MKHYFRSPWWAVFFIFFFPLLVVHSYVEFVRDSELNSRLGWLLMIGGLAYLLRHTWLQKVMLGILALMALSGAFDILYAATFGGVFTSASFEAMALTDTHEGWEFLLAYASFANVSLLAFYVAVVALSLRNIDFKTIETKRQRFFAGLGLLMVVVAVQQVYDRGRYFDVIPGFVGVGIDYARGHEGMAEIVKARQQLYATKPFSAAMSSAEPQTYVVVIGESMNRHHLQIYGYGRPTTPALQAYQAEYLRFDNVVSAFAQTSPSLRVALTEANVHNQAGYETSISLLEAAKKAGFKTFWISNQQPSRIPTTPIAANADSAHFISHDFKGVENHRYDGYLLPSVEKALADPAAHKVIFVHLMGSHLQYRNRYPEAFAVFKGKEGVKAYTDEVSSSELQYINEYDNSVLYTDFILGKLMGLLSQQKQIAALSFFADHGEEVFDSTDFKGHGPDSVTKNMVEIPFLLWRNAAYQQAFVQTERVLQNRLQAPFMLDDYFHFGLCFMHIQSNLTRPAQSWCAPEFEPLPRLVYGKDYDKEWP